MLSNPFRLFAIFVVFILSACSDSIVSVPADNQPMDNPRLSNIQMNAGKLDQIFQPNQLVYTASVYYQTTRLRLTASSDGDDVGSISIAGQDVAPGTDSDWIDLVEGSNLIGIIVTSTDGFTTINYDLTISRLSRQESIRKLIASDGEVNDGFGTSVSISGDTLAVGSPLYDENGAISNTGTVYVYTNSAGIWSLQQRVYPADVPTNAVFGRSVFLSGDDLVVGAYFDDDNGSASGSIYVFTRSGGIWTEQQKIIASDGAANQQFGNSVSLSGDTLAAAAHQDDDMGFRSGSVYVYTRSGGVWTEQQKIVAADGVSNAYLGGSISLSGDSLAAGAVGDNSWNGSTYVFSRSGGVWTLQQKISNPAATPFQYFGSSVSLFGDTLAVGTSSDDANGVPFSGSVYVLTRNAGVWTQQQNIFIDDGESSDNFGVSVSLSGESLLVGADADDGFGSAYLFTHNAGVWVQQVKFIATHRCLSDDFGRSVSLSGDGIVIGAPGSDDNGSDSGTAYVY